MKILVGVLLLIYFYLRRPIKRFNNIVQIGKLLDLYKAYFDSNEEDEESYFMQIASKKFKTEELLNDYIILAPSYKDFYDRQKVVTCHLTLMESLDRNVHYLFKSFHPRYLAQDIFFLPSKVFGFLLKHQFKIGSSFFLSSLGWIFTILISAYATEIKTVIDSLVTQLTKTI